MIPSLPRRPIGRRPAKRWRNCCPPSPPTRDGSRKGRKSCWRRSRRSSRSARCSAKSWSMPATPALSIPSTRPPTLGPGRPAVSARRPGQPWPSSTCVGCSGQFPSSGAKAGAAMAFLDPELMSLGFETLKQWMQEHPALALWCSQESKFRPHPCPSPGGRGEIPFPRRGKGQGKCPEGV